MKKAAMVTIIAICISGFCLSQSVQTHPGKILLKGTGITTGVMGDTFSGEGSVVADEKQYYVAAETVLLGMPEEMEGGAIHAKSSHRFTFYEEGVEIGVLVTEDRSMLIPTADNMLKQLVADMTVVESTGSFEGVRGRMAAQGTMMLEMVLDDDGNPMLDPLGQPLLQGTTAYELHGTLTR